jgi:hypothetical protein
MILLLSLDFSTFYFLVQPVMCLCLVFSTYDNYVNQVNSVKVKFRVGRAIRMQHKQNENLLILLHLGKKGYFVGGMIDLRRSTMTDMLGAITSYFVIMIQLFLIDPFN